MNELATDTIDVIYDHTVRRRSARGLYSYMRPDRRAAAVLPPRCHPLMDAALRALEMKETLVTEPAHVWVTVLQGYAQFASLFPDVPHTAQNGEEQFFDTESSGYEISLSDPVSDWEQLFPVFYGMASDAFPDRSTMKRTFLATPYDRERPVVSAAVGAAALDVERPVYPAPREAVVTARPGDHLLSINLVGTFEQWGMLCSLVDMMARGTTNGHARAWLTQVAAVTRAIQGTVAEMSGARNVGGRDRLSSDSSDFWKRAVFVTDEGAVDGNLCKLYPFDRYGEVAWNGPRAPDNFPLSGLRHIPFRWFATDEGADYACALHAGLVGVRRTQQQDGSAHVSPAWSWAVTNERAP